MILRLILCVVMSMIVPVWGRIEMPSIGESDIPRETPSIVETEGAEGESQDNETLKSKLVWMDDLNTAYTLAGIEYRPVFVLFSSKDCPWCVRFKRNVLSDAEIQTRLRHYILVDLPVSENKGHADALGVGGVPTVVVLSASGNILGRLDGYADINETERFLGRFSRNKKEILAVKKQRDLMRMLDTRTVPDEKWPDILRLVGGGVKLRNDIKNRILHLPTFPAEELVDALTHAELAVRLGALELLEDKANDDFGYNPWLDKEDEERNKNALMEWKRWAKGDKTRDANKEERRILTSKEFTEVIADLLQGKPEKTRRAVRILRRYDGVARLDKYLHNHDEISELNKKRLVEAKFSIIVSDMNDIKAFAMARKLVFGKLDDKLAAITQLKTLGHRAIPILKEFLRDENVLIREMAVDTLIAVGGAKVLPIIKRFLKQEQNPDVLFTALRGVGNVKSKDSVEILASFLHDPSEDLVIVALDGLANTGGRYSGSSNVLLLKSINKTGEIKECLRDKRWRVQVAALEAVGKLGMKKARKDVEVLLDHPDEFVKHKAVMALAKMSSKKSREKLKEVFFKDDQLKGAVIEAYGKMDLPIPENFVEELKKKDDDTLLSVSQHLEETGKEALDVAKALVARKNPDIACPAVAILARYGLKDDQTLDLLIRLIDEGNDDKVVILLENLSYALRSDKTFFPRVQDSADEWFEDAKTNVDTGESVEENDDGGEFGDLFAAFEGVEEADSGKKSENEDDSNNAERTIKKNEKNAELDDLFSAFEEVGKTDSGKKSEQGGRKNGESVELDDLFAAFKTDKKKTSTLDGSEQFAKQKLLDSLRRLFQTSKNNRVKFNASLLLALSGDENASVYLNDIYDTLTLEQRIKVARMMDILRGKSTRPLIMKALKDQGEQVRKAAIGGLWERKKAGLIRIVLAELNRPDAKLKPEEIINYRFDDLAQDRVCRKSLRKWAEKQLDKNKKENPKDDLVVLSLIILKETWKRKYVDRVLPFTKSKNQWIRRAAWWVLGEKRYDAMAKYLAEIADDESEFVRVIAPLLAQKRLNPDNNEKWLHYFTKKRFVNNYSWRYQRNTGLRRRKLDDEQRVALRKLCEDPSDMVRLQAYFALFAYREPIDLNGFIEVVEGVGDRQAASKKIQEYMKSNYRYLGGNFAVLLPYLQGADDISQSQMRRIRRHFGVDENQSASPATNPKSDQPLVSTYVEVVESDEKDDSPHEILVVYFTKEGCPECAKVSDMLRNYKKICPNLRLEVHDIRKIKAMLLNEAYCEKFDVPVKLRSIAPALFSGGGCLIKNEINYRQIGQLIKDSEGRGIEEWYVKPAEKLDDSSKRIKKRMRTFSAFVVAGAGLLDGINPCAFATIIFFLSYLRLARKRASEVAQVGGAFILGVFLAYFAIGVGVSELLAEITELKIMAEVVKWLMVVIVLVVLILSLYDAVMCARGRIEEISLQLPDFLKKRIRGTIRHGARQRHYIFAAFVVGVIVSFLELTCTGQVYLPTIHFMLKTGAARTLALYFLTIYNVAFITPLVLIFLLAFFGLKNESLINLFQRHAVIVKFSTAFLFLIILVFLLIM